jgi:hypothetical protein
MPQEKAGQSDRPKNSGPLTPLVPKSGWRLDRSGLSEKIFSQLKKKISEPSEIIKQTQGFEISRLLLNQPREQEQHPGIDR